jgi:hypothetical protein
MASDRPRVSDTDLERALRALGADLNFPTAPDLVAAVGAQLKEGTARRRRFMQRRLVYALALATVIAAVVFGLSPGARNAVASWLHIGGVIFRVGGKPPGPIGHNLDLGTPMPLHTIRQRVTFHVLVPTLTALGEPDGTYLGSPPSHDRVSLAYGPRRGLFRRSKAGVGLLITEFPSSVRLIEKFIGPGTTVVSTAVRSRPAVWLQGAPIIVLYFNGQGRVLQDTIRLGGNALLWQDDGVTLRLEGALSEETALAIAESMRDGARR